MVANNQYIGQDLGRTLGQDVPYDRPEPVDFAFLGRQTFDDIALERDVLQLFISQSRRIVPTLGELSAQEQSDAAHLLSGSARGIGAWRAAAAALAYESADPEARSVFQIDLTEAFAAAAAAIDGRLADLST